MNALRYLLPLLAAATLVQTGCDDGRPSGPPVIAQQPPKPPETPSRPTTQEIEADVHRIPLAVIPFSAEVPKVWSVGLAFEQSNVRSLMGPTPRFNTEAQLSQRSKMKASIADLMVNAAAGEKNSKNDPYFLAKEYRIGNVRVLERRSSERRADAPLVDAFGKEVSAHPTFMKWKITLFVPAGEDYEQYEINFSEMTVEQYEADKVLLQRIVDSLQYDPSAESTGAMPAGANVNPTPSVVPQH